MTLRTKTIPNLIQGVSQQSPMQRRDTQCEEQFDCINSPVEGCLARPPADLVKMLEGEDFEGAFCYELYRGIDEHYLVVVHDGDLRAFDLADGTECTIAFPDGKAYLATTGLPKDVFRASTLDDFTFVANREVLPAMSSTLSPSRPPEALLHFRAGGYLITYQCSVEFEGDVYPFRFKTPNNEHAANAEHITTNHLASTFYRMFTGDAAPVQNAPAPKPTTLLAPTGPSHAGSTDSSSIVAPESLTSLGFNVSIGGSSIRIWRDDAKDFSVDVSDGAGDTHFIAIKETAQSFSRLPNRGFDGMVLKVKGDSRFEEDNYYVGFTGDAAGGGVWEETIAPATRTGINPDTMPWQLINTGFREFRLEKAPWGARVVGDEITAPDPSFVGQAIEDIFFDHNRLAILTEGDCAWSKTNNPYVYFPDTVQTLLATAPVDIRLSGTRQIALLRKAVQQDEATFLWAQKAQFRVGAAGAEPFKQDTVQSKLSTNYEFAEDADPCGVAQSLYFATEPGDFATIRDLSIQDGRPRGDADVTAHVSKYVPAGVRAISASDTLSSLVVWSEGTPSRLYYYNWLLTGEERLQSAWNTWRLPPDTTILWVSVYRNSIHVLAKRPDGVAILRVNIQQNQHDPEGDYLTRLDFKITEADAGVVFDPISVRTTITLPYVADDGEILVVVRETHANHPEEGFTRGREFKVLEQDGGEVVVEGDASDSALYIGFRIRAERLESPFYIRTEEGTKHTDRLQVHAVAFHHSATGYYRVEVEYPHRPEPSLYPFEGRVLGDADPLDQITIADGSLKVPVNAPTDGYTLRLVNDSFLPSAWQTAEYQFNPVTRARG